MMEHFRKRLFDGWKIQFMTQWGKINITCLQKTQKILLGQLSHPFDTKLNIFLRVITIISKTGQWVELKKG